MIEGQSFIYYGPEPWQSMWRNRHHLLTRLARANRVMYMEPWPYARDIARRLLSREMPVSELRRPPVASIEIPRRPSEGATDRLWIYRWPLWAPLGGGPLFRPILRQLRGRHLRCTLARLGMQSDSPGRQDLLPQDQRSTIKRSSSAERGGSLIVWASHPDHALVRNDLPARLRVYHIVDEYLGYYGVPEERRLRWRRWEQELIDWADMVVAVSPELIEAKGGRGNPKFRLLPNGVTLEAYDLGRPTRRPPALADLSRPILGYVGLISVRLDLALLDALAVEHPEWTMVMVGAIYEAGCAEELGRLRSRPNVRLLPPVPAEQVPDYVRSFDLGLVPYRHTVETHHASPLKIYEYLAAGLPAVGSDVPGVRLFAPQPEGEGAPLVRLVTEPQAAPGEFPPETAARRWSEAIAAALVSNTAELANRRRRAVAAHSWDARVETLSGYLTEALARTGQETHTSGGAAAP